MSSARTDLEIAPTLLFESSSLGIVKNQYLVHSWWYGWIWYGLRWTWNQTFDLQSNWCIILLVDYGIRINKLICWDHNWWYLNSFLKYYLLQIDSYWIEDDLMGALQFTEFRNLNRRFGDQNGKSTSYKCEIRIQHLSIRWGIACRVLIPSRCTIFWSLYARDISGKNRSYLIHFSKTILLQYSYHTLGVYSVLQRMLSCQCKAW